MAGKTLLLLILGNLLWSAHPAMGKLVLVDFSPIEGAWLRYFTALLAYLAWMLWDRRKRGPGLGLGRYFARPRRASDLGLIFALGGLTFCLTPLFQMSGLQSSRATDNSLIIAMEPLMTVLLALLILGERPTWLIWGCLGVALAGFGMLAGLTRQQLQGGWDAHLWGNFLMLISLLGEASYSIFGRKVLDRYSPLAGFGSAILAGVVSLTLVAAIWKGLPLVDMAARLTWRSAFALLWLGPLGTTGGYILWMMALSRASVASIVLTLFIQPLFGAIWGSVFLEERLSALQWLGGAFIVLALAGQSFSQYRRPR